MIPKKEFLQSRKKMVSSIGRQMDLDQMYHFIQENVYLCPDIEIIAQMFRTCLYHSEDSRFQQLQQEILDHFENEMLYKMKSYYEYKHSKKKPIHIDPITKPMVLEGDNLKTLKTIQDQQVQFIFSSPPYYNAREYSFYPSYQKYLETMKQTLRECHRVLEDGRFIILNVSPVIMKRPGREFESIRYPIHFDFHQLLVESGFYYIDDIVWIKPEYSVPN